MNEHDLETTLAHIHREAASVGHPPSLRDRLLAVPAAHPARAGRPVHLPTWRLPSLSSATVLGASAAVIALSAGVLLLGSPFVGNQATVVDESSAPAATTDDGSSAPITVRGRLKEECPLFETQFQTEDGRTETEGAGCGLILSTDPRLQGGLTGVNNHANPEPGIHVYSSTLLINNSGGRWVGTAFGRHDDIGEAYGGGDAAGVWSGTGHWTAVLTGQDAYEGLTALLTFPHPDDPESGDYEGVIFSGSMPAQPEHFCDITTDPERVATLRSNHTPDGNVHQWTYQITRDACEGRGVTGRLPDTHHVVAQDGSGDYLTINEAIAAALDEDTVLVRPGTYSEAVVVDGKSIHITGDGDREQIIVSFDDGKTPVLTIKDAETRVSNLTLSGRNSQVLVRGNGFGGPPSLNGLVFDRVGIPYDGGSGQVFAVSLDLEDGTRAEIYDNVFLGGGEISVRDGSAPNIHDNTLSDGPHIFLDSAGAGTKVVDNTIRAPEFNGIGIFGAGSHLIEGNTIIDAPSFGISSPMPQPGMSPIIRGNTISGSETAISMPSGTAAEITGNDLVRNRTGILTPVSEGLIEDNRIRDGEVGIALGSGGSPTVSGNAIDVTGTGIEVGPNNAGVISGNTVCGGDASIDVAQDADASISDNEVC